MPSAPHASRTPRALLWDIDGTLIDTTTLITAALDHVYQRYIGKTLPPDDLRGIIGIPLCDQVRVFGDPAQYGSSAEEMEAEFIRYYEAHRDRERLVQPAIDALIAGFAAGRLTALVTSKNNAEIANTLPRLGILSSVHTVVTADDVVQKKPHPEGVLLALSRLNAGPAEALFIGDTVHDLRAGAAVGVARCAVMWGASPRDRLLAEKPEMVCEEPAELFLALRLKPRAGWPSA